MRAVYTELSVKLQAERKTDQLAKGIAVHKNQLHTYFCDKITASSPVLSHQNTEVGYK